MARYFIIIPFSTRFIHFCELKGCKPQDAQKPSWCADISSAGCYRSIDICCEDCEKHWTGIEGTVLYVDGSQDTMYGIGYP